jgi:hypothetical protein
MWNTVKLNAYNHCRYRSDQLLSYLDTVWRIRIRDLVLFYPKDAGSRMIFYPDLGSRILNMTKMKFLLPIVNLIIQFIPLSKVEKDEKLKLFECLLPVL